MSNGDPREGVGIKRERQETRRMETSQGSDQVSFISYKAVAYKQVRAGSSEG